MQLSHPESTAYHRCDDHNDFTWSGPPLAGTKMRQLEKSWGTRADLGCARALEPAMKISDLILEAMVNHAQFCAPEEACGLLAGEGDAIRMVYCLTNAERSRTAFTVSPAEHYRAIQHAERSGWMICGSFHSHPLSPAEPSTIDIAGALDPEWVYFIVSLVGMAPDVRAYRIEGGSVSEVALEAVTGSP